MLGQSTVATSSSSANSRIFVYEVTGLSQNDQTDRASYDVRNSGVTLLQVPYSRMNSEMRRITRLGGEIVNIYPINQAPKQPEAAAQT
jgi:CpcD/allophycocyanin linker domain